MLQLNSLLKTSACLFQEISSPNSIQESSFSSFANITLLDMYTNLAKYY